MKTLGYAALLLASATPAIQAQLKPAPLVTQEDQREQLYRSIIRIEVDTQVPNYSTPWSTGKFSGGIGTGFLIGKNRFMTNAHVVSNAKEIDITQHGSPYKHKAKVLFIAHDCDLAILEVEDFKPFEKLTPLKFAGVPKLESEVRAIGYPVGGQRISVTRGVVSRIDFRPYSHSQIDSHLVVQIDAAINPGNSGGPVIQNNAVVGVAFQGLTSADNTGYMIPTPVVTRFLKDVQDGKYDEYVDLGISEFTLFNGAMRKALGLSQQAPGILVADVTVGGSAEGVLKKGDVLQKIDGNIIDRSGSVILHGERVNMNEIVERKFAGDKVKVDFIRDGKAQQAVVTLKKFAPARMYAVQYGKQPRFTVRGGLVFQPLDRNLYAAHRLSNPRVRNLFANYISDGVFQKRKDIVILTRILNDESNTGAKNFAGAAVKSINGIEVKDLKHAHELLHPNETPEFFVIECDGISRPLILPGKDIKATDDRINQRYGVTLSSCLSDEAAK